MKRSRRWGVLLVTCAMVMAYADDAAVRKELESQYAKLGSAVQKKDLKAYMDLLTSDFTSKGLDGKKSTRQQEEAQMKETFATTKSSNRPSITIDKLEVKGSKAVATVHLKTSWVALVPNDKKEHKCTLDGRFRNTWTKTAKGWKIQGGEDLPGQKMTMDGKPIGPPPAPPKK